MTPEKVYSIATDGFDRTVRFKVLMCNTFQGNNNKFYCIEIQTNTSGEFRIFTHYGRLGKTNIYEVRNFGFDINGADREFDLIVRKKLKGKPQDGYTECYYEVDTFAPTVGSDNIRTGTTTKVVTTTKSDIIKEYSNLNSSVSTLINQICDENIHNITSMTDIKLTSTGFATPLGAVTPTHIDRARVPLNELKVLIDTNNRDESKLKQLNSLYYSLIPHKFGMKITTSDLINNNTKLLDEFNLLDTLESAVSMGDSLTADSTKRYDALGVSIDVLTDRKEYDRIIAYVYNSKADNHRHSNIWNIKVTNIFKIKIPNERKRFETQGLIIGNVNELFHGSRNSNVLSILKNGLMVFKTHPSKAGDMFGPGIYFADNSTKSANYSTGFWGGTRNRYDNNFMFVGNVALGTIKEERSSRHYIQAPTGYSSVKGVKGASLYNNEYIIYDPKQVTLRYLIEFKI